MAEQDRSGELRNELGRQAAQYAHERAAERARQNAERLHDKGARVGKRQAKRDSPFDNPVYAQAVRADFRAIWGIAMVEATNRAATAVEAEHLMLAFLFHRTDPATQLLARHGLTYEAFSDALAREREHTLAAIGIRIPDPGRLKAAPRVRLGGPRFSASAKEVWERTGRRARGRRGGRTPRILTADFLHSLLSLELGTVPRALARGGFDRAALLAAIDELTPTTPTVKESK